MKNGQFKRDLNSLDVLVVAFGAMIGWGWVVSSGSWIQNGGVLGTIIGFIIGGIMIYFVGMVYAELSTALPKTGGEQVFSFVAFGPVGSFICTWTLILSYIGVVCFEACSFPTILSYIFPSINKVYLYEVAGFKVYLTWLITAGIVTIIITLINIIGTKKSAIFQTVLTIIIAMVGVILLAGSSFSGDISNISSGAFVGNDTKSLLSNILKVAIMTPFFFFGFDVIPQAAEEIKVPLKKIGSLMIFSIVLAVAFYAMVVFSIGLVMNSSDISASMAGSGLVTADAMEKAFSSEMMAKVLIIGGLCGIVTSWNSFLIGGSRALFSMARSNMVPKKFAKISNKFGTPVNAILLLGFLSLIAPLFGKAMLTWIVDSANFACCLAYAIVSLSFLVIRKKHPNLHRPYKNKHYRFVGVVAVILSGAMALFYIIPGTNCTLIYEEWIIVGGWAVLGVIFAIWSKLRYKNEFATHVVDDIDFNN